MTTQTPAAQGLLPCPFCGNKPILHDKMETGHQPVECSKYECVMSRLWPDVKEWNRRANSRANESAALPLMSQYQRELRRYVHPDLEHYIANLESMLAIEQENHITAVSEPANSLEHGGRPMTLGECMEAEERIYTKRDVEALCAIAIAASHYPATPPDMSAQEAFKRAELAERKLAECAEESDAIRFDYFKVIAYARRMGLPIDIPDAAIDSARGGEK